MATNTVITYPIPLYSNPPIEPGFYQPKFYFILDVTLGPTTTVTTTENHDYVLGQQVRLLIPQGFGCRQLNEQSGLVLSVPSGDQVELDINSSVNVDFFTSTTAKTQPQILAIGDINSGAINTGRTNNQTFINGSFINISPNLG